MSWKNDGEKIWKASCECREKCEGFIGKIERYCSPGGWPEIYGGSPVVNTFEIQDDFRKIDDINIKDFGLETTEERAKFVMNNRNRTFTNMKDTLCNKDNKYDIVIGPVADDNMALLFRQYENEIIDFETLLKWMIYKKTSSQYSFYTEKNIKLLRKVGS